MKKILILLALIHFSIFCYSQTNIPAGEVSGFWTKSGSPYNIIGNITLTSGTLNIESGVEINFQGNYSFTISGLGNVVAKGTKTNGITFSATSSWNGLRYQNMTVTADSSIFEYCTFSRSNKIYYSNEGAGVANRDGGAIYVNTFDKIRFENCTVTNNSCKAISGSFNSGSTYGGGVFLLYASVSFINCEISNNSASFSMGAYGGGLCLQNSNAKIINCNISNNSASSGYYTRGGGLFLSNSNASIFNCNIINNKTSAPNSTGTTSFGGGLCVYGSSGLNIRNCNIVSNTTGYSPNSMGGGIYLANSINIYNSIFWDNQSYGSLSQIYGTATLYNCLHNTQINITRINCISDNPLFVNLTNSNYKLQSTSPCINAGSNSYAVTTSDYYGNPRIFGSSIDIGSHEFVVHTVIFKDWDGTKLNQQTVDYGGSANPPSNPTRIGYTFSSWDTDFNTVTSDLTVTALYNINRYSVTFKDWNGKHIIQQTVDYGSSATAPSNPIRIGYSFTGWDTDFSNVTSDITVTAEYSILTNVNASSEHAYNCYPNPVSNKFYIEIPENNNKLLTVFIVNDLGKTLYRKNTIGNTCLEIDLSNFPKGIFLIKVSDSYGQVFVKKIVKL